MFGFVILVLVVVPIFFVVFGLGRRLDLGRQYATVGLGDAFDFDPESIQDVRTLQVVEIGLGVSRDSRSVYGEDNGGTRPAHVDHGSDRFEFPKLYSCVWVRVRNRRPSGYQ